MSELSKTVICCGFTPCVQRILEFEKFKKEAVNRAFKVSICVGGKGANTARMVTQLGKKPMLIGFSGGQNGRLLEEMLTAEGVRYRHVPVSGETRICQTLVEAGNPETTELVEEMPSISPLEWQKMIALFGALELGESIVPISGKLPAGAPVDAYAQIASVVATQGGHVIIDAPDEPLLRALKYRPFMVKINDEELRRTTGVENLIDACGQLIERGAQSVLITRGAKSAFYVSQTLSVELTPPKIAAVNPVGSGDAVTAGIAVGLVNGFSIERMLSFAMACGAANALNLTSGFVRMEDVDRLMSQVLIQKLG